jgi:hypothetical protein
VTYRRSLERVRDAAMEYDAGVAKLNETLRGIAQANGESLDRLRFAFDPDHVDYDALTAGELREILDRHRKSQGLKVETLASDIGLARERYYCALKGEPRAAGDLGRIREYARKNNLH